MNARSVALRLAPYALLCAAAVAATWRILTTPGIPYNVDLSGFFPLTPDAYERRFWPLWNVGGGMSTVQFLPALLFELPLLALGRLAGFDMAAHVKLRIVLMLALSACAMYALVRHYVAKRGAPPLVVLLAPLAPALLYAFNPWSIHRVFHYFLWVGYAMAPLVLLALERLVDRPSWRRGVVLALTYALATTDPHNPPLLALLMAPLFLARVVPMLWRDRARAFAAVKHAAVAAGVYLAIGLYWILPYAYNALFNESFGPTYVLSEQMIATLSRNGDVWSVLVLSHNYLPRAPLAPTDPFWNAAWAFGGIVLLQLAVLGLLVRREATTLAYGVIGAGAVVLGMGSTPPFTGSYDWLIFRAPWGEGLSWLFRDPFRWGFFQVLAYCVLGGFAIAWLTQRALALPRLRVAAPAPGVVAVGCVLLFALPSVTGYVSGPFAPVEIPSEFAEANAALALTPEDTQVVWMPRMLGKTTWGGDRTMEYFDATSSARPALGPFRPHTEAYFGLVQDSAMAGGPVPELLARAGIDVVVYHADRNPDQDALNLAALEAAGLEPMGGAGGTPVDLVPLSTAQPANTPASRFQLYGTRALNQTFVAPQNATRVEVKVVRVGSPGPLEATFFDLAGAVVHRANVTVADDGVVALPLAGKLKADQAYALRLRARSNASADRFEVSFYRVDAYPEGTLTAKVGTAAPVKQDGDLWMRVHAADAGFVRLLKNPEPSPVVQASRYAIASPSGLDVMGLVDSLPESPRSNATILFLNSGAAARKMYRAVDDGWVWVQGLDEGELESAAAFVPESSIVAPFGATANADSKLGWARGTRGFTYEQWGWPLSLASLGHVPRDLDNDKGLVFTSAKADVTVSLPGEGERVLLARVYSSPAGGTLAFRADDGWGAKLSTLAETPAFRWVEVASLGPDARTLTLSNENGFQGVNLLAAVPKDAWASAKAQAAARFAKTPVLLASRAVDVPTLGEGRLALPGTGSLVVLRNGTLAFDAPIDADYTLALRVTPASALTMETTCVADCGSTLEWRTAPLGRLTAGRHEVALAAPDNATAQLSLVAVTTDATLLQSAPNDVAVPRLDALEATSAAFHLDGGTPLFVTFTTPRDAGWELTSPDGAKHYGALANGVGNLFHVDGEEGEYVVAYAPQRWADRGAVLSAVALACVAAAFLARAYLRRRDAPAPEEAA